MPFDVSLPPLFKVNGESIDHLFLHCLVAKDLWSMILGLFGVIFVMPKSVVELLASWQDWFGRHRNGHVWMVIPHYLMQCLWWERNSRCIEDKERSMPGLIILL